MVEEYLVNAIATQRLPNSYADTVARWIQPLAQSVADAFKAHAEYRVLGIQGPQGSGKSTLGEFLRLLLVHKHGLSAVTLSLDDFYLTRAQRQALAADVHPLLITRGVPGTHDVALAARAIDTLKTQHRGAHTTIPRFDKARDERAAEDQWTRVEGPVDVIIFEGWCLGARPQPTAALGAPINALERDADTEGRWRRYVNEQLSGPYTALFALLDQLIVLTAPSFDCVYQWRLLQEQKLRERWSQNPGDQPPRIMSAAEIKTFISHYERLTRHCAETLPPLADWHIRLDTDHQISTITRRSQTL